MVRMNPHREPSSKQSRSGFSALELIVVVTIVGIISAVVMMKGTSPATLTLPSQAQTLASDIRHTQTLAYTSGRRMRITFSSAGYSVSCVDADPCPAAFTGVLENGVTLSSFGITPLDFDSLGRPFNGSGSSTSAAYTLASGGDTKTVSVSELTGFVANP